MPSWCRTADLISNDANVGLSAYTCMFLTPSMSPPAFNGSRTTVTAAMRSHVLLRTHMPHACNDAGRNVSLPNDIHNETCSRGNQPVTSLLTARRRLHDVNREAAIIWRLPLLLLLPL